MKWTLEPLFAALAMRIDGPKAWETDLTTDFMVKTRVKDPRSLWPGN